MAELTLDSIHKFANSWWTKSDGIVTLSEGPKGVGVLCSHSVRFVQSDASANVRLRQALLAAFSGDRLAGGAYLQSLRSTLTGAGVIDKPLTGREIKALVTAHEEMHASVSAFGKMVKPSVYGATEKEGVAGLVAQAAGAATTVVDAQGLGELLKASHVKGMANTAFKALANELTGLVTKAGGALKTAYALKGADLASEQAGKAVDEAAAALFDLESKIRDVVNAKGLKLTEGLSLLMDYAAARASELLTVWSEARAAQADGVAGANADATLRDLVAAKAGGMHGNAAYVQKLADQVSDLEQGLQALKHQAEAASERASQPVSKEAIAKLRTGFVKLRAALQETEVSAAEGSLSAALLTRVTQDIVDLRQVQVVDVNRQIKQLMGSYLADDDIKEAKGACPRFMQKIKAGGVPDQEDVKKFCGALDELNKADPEDLDELQLRQQAGRRIFNARLKGVLAQFTASEGALPVSPQLLHRLVKGEIGLGSAVGAYAYGFAAEDVDPTLDDRFVAKARPLGSGAVNTVEEITYALPDGTRKTRVFKPEADARIGLDTLVIGGPDGYDDQNLVGEINVATRRCAEALGCPETAVHVTVGVHDGKIGFFMEKAQGLEAKKAGMSAVDGKPTGSPFAPETLANLGKEEKVARLGTLARELCKLEWQDWLTGQGDRHKNNYLVDLDAKKGAVVKGIDNDAAFTAYRVGLRRFVLSGERKKSFLEMMNVSTIDDLPGAIEKLLGKQAKGFVTEDKGRVILDFDELDYNNSISRYVASHILQQVFGINNSPRPQRIPKAIATWLRQVEKEGNYDEVAGTLMAGHFSPAQKAATAARLREMVAYAHDLLARRPDAEMDETDWLKEDTLRAVVNEQKVESRVYSIRQREYLVRDFADSIDQL